MASEPPATDLGAIRARHVERPIVLPSGVPATYCPACGSTWPCDAARLYDAQAAQLADAERRARVVVGWCLECEQYERLLVCCQECQDAQAARLEKLAALEAAARQWHAAAARTRPYAGELVPWKQEGWQAAMDALDAAEAALDAALAALDAPPEESP